MKTALKHCTNIYTKTVLNRGEFRYGAPTADGRIHAIGATSRGFLPYTGPLGVQNAAGPTRFFGEPHFVGFATISFRISGIEWG
jgi:hypothetical protein